jgi:hypothetical protein
MRQFCALSVALISAISAISCGDQSDDAQGGAGSGSGGSATGIAGTLNLEPNGSAGTLGSGATAGNPQMQDGGVIELTDDQVDDLNGAACAGWSAEPETQPAVLQLVVDTSLSMDEPPNGRGGRNEPTKWDITREALQEVLSTLPEELAIGLFFYPNMSTEGSDDPRPVSACVNLDEGISVQQLGDEHRENLIQVFDDTEPNGWTPTHGAYEHALQTSLLPADFPGQKYLLLITDGVPTLTHDCQGSSSGGQAAPVDTDPIVEAIAEARLAGVRTFLIGSPGSEDGRQWMSLAAIQGATARAGCQVDGAPYCHMDMTTAPDFSAALRAGLNQVTGEISCTYDVPEPPEGEVIDPNLVNLIVTTSTGDAQLVLPDANGDCSEGWQLTGNQVVLCEGTCSRVQSDGASLQLLFGCETGGEVVPK